MSSRTIARGIERPQAGLARRQDFAKGHRRLLYEHLAWPVAAVTVHSVAGYLFMPEFFQSIWLAWSLLTLAGAFLSVQRAALLGGLAFVSAMPWMFVEQHTYGINGGVFMVFALLPFAPIWLAAARARQLEATRLHMLLELPQVRAAMTVSDWSLLPNPRVIDRRLRQHLSEGKRSGKLDPALVFRVRFRNLAQASDLLGEREMQQLMLRLADALRSTLRAGDMIAEDVRDHGLLYVLAFPNPDYPGSESAIVRRLKPPIDAVGLPGYELQVAAVPEDGRQIYALQWREPAA
jgi:hypothetical protein